MAEYKIIFLLHLKKKLIPYSTTCTRGVPLFQATCAVDGREEVSFGRRRRRALPENATATDAAQPADAVDVVNPADLLNPAKPSTEKEKSDTDEESEEYVQSLMNVSCRVSRHEFSINLRTGLIYA